jgi:hypothetical protein
VTKTEQSLLLGRGVFDGRLVLLPALAGPELDAVDADGKIEEAGR